jgi:hypothetical protein
VPRLVGPGKLAGPERPVTSRGHNDNTREKIGHTNAERLFGLKH